MPKTLAAALCSALLLVTSAPVRAQDPEPEGPLQPLLLYAGIQGVYARPVGEFRNYVRNGGGLNFHIAVPVGVENPLAIRAEGGFLIYGSETRRVCFGGGVGCRILLDLTTTNSIGYFNIGPQLMTHRGGIRPYANAAVGAAYFGTQSSLEGSSDRDGPFASTTNFSDLTLQWAGGGGVMVPLSRGRTPVFLDVAVRYNGNGQVEYLKKGDIEDNPDGSITISPTRSDANLVTFQLGITVGARRGTR
jgi:hypothetical protein